MRQWLGLVFTCVGLSTPAAAAGDWPQWRGPGRDGLVPAAALPPSIGESVLKTQWRTPLGPSYSGPIVAGDRVFVTESSNQTYEAALALDRKTGAVLWRTDWEGYVKAPFFARANGDWIRSTPATDGERLFVGGMRDTLVCLDVASGRIAWRKDLVAELKTPVPEFGLVSSPLLTSDAVFVQAGAAVVKLAKADGTLLWRAMADEGGMLGSAFSSPVLARLGDRDQLLVQSRDKLAGLDPANGTVLWEQPVEAFRGMNILTPTVWNGAVFTSAYGGKTLLYSVAATNGVFRPMETWSLKAEGYMSSPLVLGDHAYLHLRNQRFTCIDLRTGKPTWETEKKFGKYWSLVSDGKEILALDQTGTLLRLKADPARFTQLESRTISEAETWAHLAVSGRQLFVRALDGLAAFTWD